MRTGHFSPDILEFFRLLYVYKVHYLIVGGEAVIYYGNPRLTGDVDFYYGTTPPNIDSLYQALLEFWGQDIPGLNEKSELAQKNNVVQFGVPPNRIDLMSNADGLSFEGSWKNREIEELEIGGEKIEIYYIGLKDLIRNKEKTGRHRDLEDLEYLRRLE